MLARFLAHWSRGDRRMVLAESLGLLLLVA
jgi:hypothetical protein